MNTLCIAGDFAQADYVNEMMQQLDPEGTHRIEEDTEDAWHIIRNAAPDVVWLAAKEENLALAEESLTRKMHINYIFASDDESAAVDAFKVRASGFVAGPVTEEAVREELANLRYPADVEAAELRVQCFGNFEVFRHGKIIRFARSLSKEALAYLVDRRGAGCTVSEICSVLWENRPVDTNLKSQCRVILASLKKDLEAVNAEDVLVKGWNTWGIDAEKISCDYYDFLKNAGRASNTYRGEYMAQYSWAEMTSGSLYQMTDD